MKDKLLNIRKKHPLSVVLLIALFFKVIAMVFSKGYGFENEYFFYVETPNAWLDNIDYDGYSMPQGISLLYVTINYLIFGSFKLFGIHNPQWLMFFSRLIHGLLSLTVITLGYRITKILSDRKSALDVAWILALLWFVPYISVHTIAPAVSVPFILYGTLLVVKQEKLRNELKNNNLHRTSFIIAGVFFALGFSIWYYSILLYLAIIIVLSAKKNIKGSTMTLIGFLVTVGVTQTVPDLIVWGRPLVELRAFISNIGDISLNIQMSHYAIAIVTALIITTFLTYRKNSLKNSKHNRAQRYLCAFGMFINFILLITTTLMYSNKPEVKAMTHLSKDKNVNMFIINDEYSDKAKRPPLFYEKNWSDYIVVNQDNIEKTSTLNNEADYIVFRGNSNMNVRLEAMKKYYPNLKHEVTYKPYFAYIMYKWLNHSTTDGCVSIYKVSHEY